jgi:uncharacterized phiE125 gp8 family phage protein
MPAATKTTTLFSLDAVKSYLTVKSANTDQDAILVRIADGVSERIEQLTQRAFVTRLITETLDGNGRSSIRFNTFPIQTISQLRTRTDLSFSFALVDPANYVLEGRTGIVHLKADVFPLGPLTVEGQINAGFGAQDGQTLPADVYQAGLDWVKFVYDRKAAGLVLAGSANMGNMSIALIPEPPKDVLSALQPWKKLRL